MSAHRPLGASGFIRAVTRPTCLTRVREYEYGSIVCACPGPKRRSPSRSPGVGRLSIAHFRRTPAYSQNFANSTPNLFPRCHIRFDTSERTSIGSLRLGGLWGTRITAFVKRHRRGKSSGRGIRCLDPGLRTRIGKESPARATPANDEKRNATANIRVCYASDVAGSPSVSSQRPFPREAPLRVKKSPLNRPPRIR